MKIVVGLKKNYSNTLCIDTVFGFVKFRDEIINTRKILTLTKENYSLDLW